MAGAKTSFDAHKPTCAQAGLAFRSDTPFAWRCAKGHARVTCLRHPDCLRTVTVMRWTLIGLLAGHGLIHLMGFAKAFGLAELPQLALPITRDWGVLWLVASGLVVATAVLLAIEARPYWIVGGLALLVSQLLIMTVWRDAWAGTVANAALLIVVAHGFFTEGPWSLHAQFLRDVSAGLARPFDALLVAEVDLATLPEPVRRYLRITRAIGQPRVHNYGVRFTGRIRSDPASTWMPFEAVQQSFADEPTRLFLMRAHMFGVPVEAFHRLVDGHATMRVKVAGAVSLVDARGDDMDRAETVTLFNDMCILAPGTLVGPGITWEPIDGASARARFTHRGHTITATLFFASDGRLVNFESDDRSRASPDERFAKARFSTPLRDYRDFGPLFLAGHGEARWRLPEGEFIYGEFTMLDVVTSDGARADADVEPAVP